MSAQAVISVVMPLYNGEKWLTATLKSLAEQEMSDWELLVVDDQSTDSGPGIVDEFSQSVRQDVHLIAIERAGPSVARNHGINRARGRYVAFLDADDLWHRNKLADQVRILEESNSASGAICDYAIMGIDGKRITYHRSFEWNQRSLNRWALMESYSPCLNSTLVVRRSVLDTIGGFTAEMTNVEDLDLAFRLARCGQILSTNKVQMTYRMHPNQNHKNRDTIIRDYRVFLDRWSDASPELHRRGLANLDLLEGQASWSRGKRIEALSFGLRSLTKAPAQWLRLLTGVQNRRRQGRMNDE
jgi:glycosyltransferase involved in cell wall biosynthesis